MKTLSFKQCIAGLLVFALLFSFGACAPKQEPFEINTDGMTEAQKAVVVTAESYYLRGKYAQYDMYNLVKAAGNSIERRTVGQKVPEDYTAQYVGYTDCSGFAHDVYLNALDVEIGKAWTKTYAERSIDIVLREFPDESLTEQQVREKLDTFKNTLQPGDIIVYRYKGNEAGHTLIYVGNGMVVHSSGSSYKYDEAKEVYEENGTYLYDSLETLLTPGTRRYILDKHVYVIWRPLNSFIDEIPEQTQTRMTSMRGIKAEKIASHTLGQTVSPNEEITFTFRIQNCGTAKQEMTVTDTIPDNTTYVSGGKKTDNTVEWSVTVAPGKTKEVSYTVKANDKIGETIVSNGFISGIPTNCQPITIANTLTEKQQKELLKNAENAKKQELKDLAFVNALYGENTLTVTNEALWDNLYMVLGSDFIPDTSLPLWKMVAPRLYGGRSVGELVAGGEEAAARIRMLVAEYMIVGDILVMDDTMYLFRGTNTPLLNLSTLEDADTELLDTAIAAEKFVVFRPSMVQ